MVKAYHHSNDYGLPYCDWGLKLIYEGECKIEFHLTLPEAYEDKPRFVYWCGVETGKHFYGENGTGDDQIWYIAPKAKRAVPMQRATLHMDLISDE